MDEDLVTIRRRDGDQFLKRAAWGRVLHVWRESGLQPTAFARQHGIAAKAFFRWRAKLLPRLAAPVDRGFVELAVTPVTAGGEVPLEVHLGQTRILLRQGCSADLLRMLWRVVQEAGC